MTNGKKPQTILVVGGNGFVGGHLIDELAALPNTRILCFDRFFSPEVFLANENVESVKGDFFDSKAVAEALKGVDYVFHCFSATTPSTSDENPYADVETLRRSIEIFEQCVKEGVKKIAFISSGGAVYGNMSEERSATEEDMPMPVSPYGICKLAIEHYLEYFKRKQGMPYIVYRLTNPYGPRQTFKKNQGVIPAFMGQIMQNEEITIYGDGNASRDFIYIGDAVKMMAQSFDKDNQHATYNIGSGQQTTLNGIVAQLQHLTADPIKVVYKEAPKTFLKKTSVSIDRFCGEFGEPNLTTMAEGLKKTFGSVQ